MEWKKYQKLAFRTNAHMGIPLMDNIHMVLGIQGEIGELASALFLQPRMDWVNIVEEIFDTTWYISGLCEFLKIDLDWKKYGLGKEKYLTCTLQEASEELLFNMVALSSNLGDIFKKELAYKKLHHPKEVKELLEEILELLVIFCEINDIDFGKGLERNIEKLKVRYPAKFTEKHAISRDLEKERDVLEGLNDQ